LKVILNSRFLNAFNYDSAFPKAIKLTSPD
jgi:hypothetical protein